MGLAERSSNNPLKIIHYLLEKDVQDEVRFLGISNWRLDAAKINRALNLSITDYDKDDLKETAVSIADALNLDLSNKYKDFFETLAVTYYKYILYNQNNIKENKDFHGNRDFYNLIKIAMKELNERKNNINNENKVLTEIGNLSLDRNFGGLEDSSSKIKEIFKNEFGHKYVEDLNYKFSVLDAIKKNILDPNSRYLMLISEDNDGSDIIKYLLDSMDRKYIELIGSKYKTDIKSGLYSEEILNKIKYIMETDNVLILRDLDMIYASLYDLFNQNFTCIGDKKFARIAFEYAKISSEVNKDFHAIVIVNKNQIKDLKLDPPFLNRFEKHIIDFELLLEKRDIEIAKKIFDYFSLISSFNNNTKLRIDLEKMLINCKLHNIEGLIFKIKNDNENNGLFKEDNPEYEMNLMKEIFKKIVPTFCQDIIASIISSNLNRKYNTNNEIVLNIYKNTHHNNFQSFFEKIEAKRNIIYTFSKITESLFDEDKSIENKYGKFSKKTTFIEMIDSYKSENDLIFLLQTFINTQDKNLLIFSFSSNDLNKMCSTNYIIDNFQKENPTIKDKIIIFVVHMKRYLKGVNLKKIIIPDLISFINDNYYQIFIDNLQGKENSDIFTIIQKKEEVLAKEYLESLNFIDNKIFVVFNYMDYNILYETKELNSKNFTKEITRKIIENDYIKELINNNLKLQGKSIKGIIKDVFISDNIEVNDVDFFEIINSKLSNYFCLYLLNIIYHALNENILIQILFGNHFDSISKIEYFQNLINSTFIKEKFGQKLKTRINANQIKIYNGLDIPKIKNYLDIIVNYIDKDISQRYIENEELLRKNYKKEEKIIETKRKYYYQLQRFEDNLKNELNKYEIFTIIYKQEDGNLKKLLLEDYFKYFIIKMLEDKEVDYKANENMLNFLIFIIQIKLSPNNNKNYDFDYSNEEFIKIILFTQSYKDDLRNLFETFIEVNKYCPNIVELMKNFLNEGKIKYEISDRNKKHTEIVNKSFFNILEPFIKSILICTIELLKNNKIQFYDYFLSLASIEANLHKINKKFYLFSKEIYNIRMIIKIEEAFKQNHEQFENNYENIINNLFKQSILLYNKDFNNLFDLILELIKILDDAFKEKNDDYINIIFFIFKQQYRNAYNDEFRLKLIENFFGNKLLIKKSYLFLSETLKNIKPEVFKIDNEKDEKEDTYINNFLNPQNKQLKKYENLIKIINNIDSSEFNEILLYFFENQCQSYFQAILNNFNNSYSKECCNALLNSVSLGYLKKSLQYLYQHKENNENNLFKLYAIAYLKKYFYYYVEINHSHFDNCNFEEINNLLNDKDENNKLVRNMRNIYIWRLYFRKINSNFEVFENYNFNEKNIPICSNELLEILSNEKKNKNNISNYIFKECFIPQNSLDNYKKLSNLLEQFFQKKQKELEINIEEINKNFDSFYCLLVNKIISYLYGQEKNKKSISETMKYIYEKTFDKIQFLEEGKILYKHLLNKESLDNEIIKKISKDNFTQQDFEILLYSLRFVFNIQIIQNKCFYNELLKSNTEDYIEQNYIPGSFPILKEFVKAYNDLEKILQDRPESGYYVCKDCGYLYEVPYCSFPMSKKYCPNGHVIGGENHLCSKPDIRVFLDKKEDEKLRAYWNHEDWHNSFVHKTLEEFKKEYVDQYFMERQKGIVKNLRYVDFTSNNNINGLNIISFRIMNFILFSFLNCSYILGHLSEDEMKSYSIENLFPQTLFGVIKEDWNLLDKSLKEIGISNIQVFLNMIFEKVVEIMKKLESVNTKELLVSFEEMIDDYIKEIINDNEKIEKMNNEYKKMNDEILNCDPQSMKEIIQSNYDPSLYDQKKYPDIQYYSVSNIVNLNTFQDKFNSSLENKKKYALTNILINKNLDINKGAIKMKYLNNINKLGNLLLNMYSFKISREKGKNTTLKKELNEIIEIYNEINSLKINDEEEFIKEYITPFLESWKEIKDKSIQYKCKLLVNFENGEKSKDLSLESPLCFFLVDDGDQDGGMFLASAYQNFIEWQNKFINDIISKNSIKGILNSYVPKLEQEIYVQDATKEEIINIDESTYKTLNELVSSCSMRNIFAKNKLINYSNYNDIIYDLDYIEEEMGKIILPRLKKFKHDKIKFITYLYEGFRGNKSSVIVDYNEKYKQKDLNEEEKKCINELIQENNNNKFYSEVFSSLQILMNQIINENYEQNYNIYDIIKSLPNYIILNEKLMNLFKIKYEMKENVFSINSLVSIFEYFEAICWKEINKNILPDYKLDLPDRIKDYILEYFESIKNEKKVINKTNFTYCLRKLMSRFIVGTRQEIDIKSDVELKLYVGREELWNKEVIDSNSFDVEIFEIFKPKILIGHTWDLYYLLKGDDILNKELYMDKNKENQIGNVNEINPKFENNNEEEKNYGNENDKNKNNEKDGGESDEDNDSKDDNDDEEEDDERNIK